MNSSQKPWESTRLPYILGAGEPSRVAALTTTLVWMCVSRLLKLELGRSVCLSDGRSSTRPLAGVERRRTTAARSRRRRSQEARSCLGMLEMPYRDTKLVSILSPRFQEFDESRPTDRVSLTRENIDVAEMEIKRDKLKEIKIVKYVIQGVS